MDFSNGHKLYPSGRSGVSHSHSHSKWLPICEQFQRKEERMHEIDVPNRWLKTLCVLLMLTSALLFFFGRGTFGLIQGIIGLIFGIEGFYGAMEYSRKSIRRFIIFLIISTLVSVIFGFYSLTEVDTYCATSDENSKEQCTQTVNIWTILYLGMGCVFNLILIFFFGRFYIIIGQHNVKDRAADVLD